MQLTPEQLKVYKLKKAQAILEEEKIDTKELKAKIEKYVKLDKNR
jgi:sulfur relay (sulfurtransferase) DsrF/TusC family protein